MEKKRKLKFEKWQGLGNDFVFVDSGDFEAGSEFDLGVRLCDRKFGVGADGMIILGDSSVGDVQMRLINEDGTEAQMCGNATRCVTKKLGVPGKDLKIETPGGVKVGRWTDDGLFRVQMGTVQDVEQINEDYFVKVPNKHFVVNVQDYGFSVKSVGAQIGMNSIDREEVNVNFLRIESPKKVEVRTWERGVGPTLACGTGCVASVVAGKKFLGLSDSVHVTVPGGYMRIEVEDGIVYMTGPAEMVYEGEIEI